VTTLARPPKRPADPAADAADPAGGGLRSRRRAAPSPPRRSSPGFAAPERVAELEAVAERYAIGRTPALARLIDKQDLEDPIARQFVPDARELSRHPRTERSLARVKQDNGENLSATA